MKDLPLSSLTHTETFPNNSGLAISAAHKEISHWESLHIPKDKDLYTWEGLWVVIATVILCSSIFFLIPIEINNFSIMWSQRLLFSAELRISEVTDIWWKEKRTEYKSLRAEAFYSIK